MREKMMRMEYLVLKEINFDIVAELPYDYIENF
jgi:hypothetical protein